MTAPIRSMPELVAALRTWRDERGITHEVFDDVAGWAKGYAGKLLAPQPIKNLGWMSLGDALSALAIELVVVEDKEQRKLVEGRWTPRERPKNGSGQARRASIKTGRPEMPNLQPQNRNPEYMKMIGKRGASKGGKRRAKLMKKRARQRAASHAARARWSKRHA